ncbi:mRNA 3' end processing factor [Purpureocillium takamizusanense]|uniref:mRNA 3' end processing factor n=1 Tax=Purpureocillium takamizusanense TaxID=2060973 RepID=A0A9Q8QBB7_9HYPO|nr:mRNA 3' end processing factor [Purpureocillium takamizusanense]UNI16122.1 mRNA 3' end processing factor [Purpureocillium takamizusanense]
MSSDAEEVAEDYRHALEDLSSNMRFEISNLTVIARENTEHALAIAEVLQQHILKAAPNKKLPALYVLDSIVKNVGTPYTLYFGRNLFKTFMESYAVVDHNIRRKMEEMLKTWKDPVPGSMDTRPVFSHELVRPIENALMKARAASMPPQGPIPGRPRSAMLPNRNTPTPPAMRGQGQPPPAGPYPPHILQQSVNGGRPGETAPAAFGFPVQQQQQQQYPPHLTPQPGIPAQALYQPPYTGSYGQGLPAPVGISVDTLSNDIQNLIVAMKAEFTQKPHDAGVQNRLKALLDLQGVMQRTSLPRDQLELIKNKVTELAAVTLRPASAPGSTQGSTLVPPMAHVAAPHSASVTPAPAGNAPVTLDGLLGHGALAALLSRQSATPQNTTPNPPYSSQAIRSPPPPPVQAEQTKPPAPTQAPSALSLLDQLRQAGVLPNATPPNAAPAVAPPPPAQASILPPNIASLLSSAKAQGLTGLAPPVDPGLSPAALKSQFRPDAVAALYDKLGPPCTQCGRRFRTDEEGRKRKMAHMDWHFRVHQRSTEAEKRGTHRSWYVDSQDWLKSREVIDSDHVGTSDNSASQNVEVDKGPKYIPVPDPSSGINTVCPICQERFENKWLDTAQEWVWLDAVLVGNRAYHASCHAEATRDREGTPGTSRRTPEPVLGKRKAETNISSPKIRTMKTSV